MGRAQFKVNSKVSMRNPFEDEEETRFEDGPGHVRPMVGNLGQASEGIEVEEISEVHECPWLVSELKSKYKFDICALFKTKSSGTKARKIASKLGFSHFHILDR